MAAKKLGEILVDGQKIGSAALKKALDAQLIFGGRLGTNLLELGFLDEVSLTEALQQQSQVQVATPRLLEEAPKEALRLIPPKLAAKHKVIPFGLQGKKLQVAMVDPTDLIVLDEIAFVTGCTVAPFVAPEVRLLTYLERYYDVSRPLRYIQLADPSISPKQGLDDQALAAAYTDGQLDLESRQTEAEKQAAARLAQPTGPPPTPSTGEAAVSPEGERVLSISDLLEPGGGAEAAAERLEQVTPEALAQVDTASEEQQAMMDAALEELKRRRAAEALAVQEAEDEEIQGLEDVARLLAEAETREDIGEALLRYLRTQFPRVLTYVVQRDRALGWMAKVPGLTGEQARIQARRVVVPLGEPSVLSGVAQTGQYYMGELPARPGDEAIAAALGSPRPANLVLLPVKLNEKTVIVLQGDNLDRALTGFDMRSLRAACQKAGLAMEVLLLRSKIRQVQ